MILGLTPSAGAFGGKGESGGAGGLGGGIGDGIGGDGGGEVGGEAIVTAGFSSIVMPGAVEAAAAVPRVEASEVCTAAAVVEAGTVMVTMMSTLPAVMAMVTSDLSTPAVVATPCRKF